MARVDRLPCHEPHTVNQGDQPILPLQEVEDNVEWEEEDAALLGEQRPDATAAGAGARGAACRAMAVSSQGYRLGRAAISVVWDNGLLAVSFAALVFSVGGLAVKLVSATIPLLEIVAVRSIISLTIVGSAIAVRNVRPVFGHKRNLWKLAARGVFGCTAMTTYYVGLYGLPLADATTIFFLNPVFTAVLAWAVRGEALGWQGILGCMASLAGVALVAHPPFLFGGHAEWGSLRLIATTCMVISATCASFAFIAIRSIGRSEPSIVVSLWFHATSLMTSAIPLAASFPAAPVLPNLREAMLLIVLACSSFVGQLFITRGFQLEAAARVAAVNYSQVLYGYFLGWLCLGDGISMTGVAGSALVAVGVLATTHDTARDKAGRDVQLTELQAAAAGPSLTKDFSVVLDRHESDGWPLQQQQQQRGQGQINMHVVLDRHESDGWPLQQPQQQQQQGVQGQVGMHEASVVDAEDGLEAGGWRLQQASSGNESDCRRPQQRQQEA